MKKRIMAVLTAFVVFAMCFLPCVGSQAASSPITNCTLFEYFGSGIWSCTLSGEGSYKIDNDLKGRVFVVGENGITIKQGDGGAVTLDGEPYSGNFSAGMTVKIVGIGATLQFATAASSVSLDKEELTLMPGDTYVLTPTVLPKNAESSRVSWSGDNGDVAYVGEEGDITAVKPGQAVITVTTVDGGFTASCVVTVVSYAIDESSDDLWTLNQEGSFILKGNGNYKEFSGLEIDEEPVSEKYLTVTEGSTIVEVSSEFMDTLDEGEHTYRMLWMGNDYSAEGSFTVEAAPVPTTGDNARPFLYMGLILFGVAGLMSMYIMKNSEEI